jgi:hypothetical protein
MVRDIDLNQLNRLESDYKSIDLGKKLSKKTFLLQYQPRCLDSVVNSKYILYKDKKLKTSYLFDIVNNLILKYYFRGENRYTLNATILKDKYGYLYNYYIDYLVYSNILNLICNYKKGVSSRVYALNNTIFKDKEIKRYKNVDKVLIKKYKKKIFNTIDFTEDSNLIDIDIKGKLLSDLFSIDIDMTRSIFYLDSLKDRDMDIYNRNLYSVDCINNKHIFYHFDSYGRMHTNFTILKSFIRKNCLLIDGKETCEIDISNSQPLFLSKLINDSRSSWIDLEEFDLFKKLTRFGNYYQYMMHILGIDSKNDIKELTYRVLFGRNATNSKSDRLFRSVFPTIHNFIKLYKNEHGDYKILAYDLQKMESNLIYNKIIKRIVEFDNSIRIVTVHDSIITLRDNFDIVNNIFQQELNNEFDF